MNGLAAEQDVRKIPTASIISQMLLAFKHASDLILSPYQARHVRLDGQLVRVKIPGVEKFSPEDTARIAADIIGPNPLAQRRLKEEGSCDVSYSIPTVARLRVNIFTQRGTYAIQPHIPVITRVVIRTWKNSYTARSPR